MRKIAQVFVLLFAANFLALAGAVGWMVSSGHLDRARLVAVRDVVFPPPVPAVPATQPATQPSTQPSLKLEELLAQHAGRPASEQLDYIRRAFDAQMAQLDRAQRELLQLQRQIELAQSQLARDRAALKAEQKALDDRRKQADQLAADKGFQDSLTLYESLPAKQVKSIFMALDDETVLSYLQAMEPRSAAKITKEFKLPQEVERLKVILEKMRQAQASADTAPNP